jgi:flagellar biosynthetic protein FliQ
MTQDFAVQVLYRGIMTTLLVSMPVVGIGLLVGFTISVFQAVTQIQEQTLTFVPKVIAVLLMIAVTAPWTISLVVDFTTSLWSNIAIMAR